ncbi:hypothetical protein [Arthrobacter sp. JSM 101049]|uniref:hypothetical protein n=1 Tax=Arthrobacter sp. JSM 101049 TaxID=929097 RepID=UPI0035625F20
MAHYNPDVYEEPEVRQALAKLFVDLNNQLSKNDRWEIPKEIQELSNRERRVLTGRTKRRKQAI